MKIIIETDNKTVIVNSRTSVGELLKEMEKFFPNDYKEFLIITSNQQDYTYSGPSFESINSYETKPQ